MGSKKVINKKLSLLICYENNSGGETIAVQQIIRELIKKNNLRLKAESLDPLIRTSSLGYFGWIFQSIAKWTSIIAKPKTLDWVYSTTYTAGVAAAILKPLRNFKICFHYHGSRISPKYVKGSIIRQLTQLLKYEASYWLHRLLFKCVDIVIVTSLYSKNYLVRSLRLSKTKKIKVVPNGVNLSVFKRVSPKNRASLRGKMGIPRNSKAILIIGRLNPLKRVALAIKTLPLIIKSIPNLVLLIAHPRPITQEERSYKRELLSLAKARGVEKNIMWREGEKNISNLYGVSDLVVLLSKQENLPLVMLESFATKTLFASTPAGGINSYLNGLDSRLIISSTNPEEVSKKIINLLGLGKKQKTFITSSCYKVARGLSWEKTSVEILRCLSES